METICEFVSSRGSALRVDREKGIIHGVKLLGLESQNGRLYPIETIREAATLYKGAKVNIDHGKGKDANRSYADRMGRIGEAVEVRADGLYGDLHYNPKHALAEQLAWDAENAPENVGMSHVVEGKTSSRGGKLVVESITRVQSVDLVADPATTNGLFEYRQAMKKTVKQILRESSIAKALKLDLLVEEEGMAPLATAEVESSGDVKADTKAAFRSMVIAAFDDESLDTAATLARIKEILKAQEKLMGGGEKKDPPADAGGDTKTEEAAQLRAKLAMYEAKEAVDKLLSESKLPESVITPAFRTQLVKCSSDAERKELIEDRRLLAGSVGSKPRSKDQQLAEGRSSSAAPTDSKSFASSICD